MVLLHEVGQLHYDLATLKPVRRLPNGTVIADAHLTRTGIFEYRNPDGSTRRELRLPEEVFRPDSMRSFCMVPATDDHPPEMLTSENALNYARGSTGDSIVRDDDHLRGSIAVFAADTIAKMDAGKIELSCGYTCDLDEKPGTHPLWGAYDAIQRNIVGNHVALVDKGRAGSSAALRMDAATMVTDGDPDQARDDLGRFGSGGGSPGGTSSLTANEKTILHALATMPKRTSDLKLTKRLGITQGQLLIHGNSIRTKLNLSPLDDLHAHATALHKGGHLTIRKGDSADSDGTRLASTQIRGTLIAGSMSKQNRTDAPIVDPDDLASRNARGETDDDADPDDPDEEDMDAAAKSCADMYDDEGNLTPAGSSKIAASTFAVPAKGQLPIHDAAAVKSSMKAFGSHEFDGADEKHAAFNRITGKASQFGIGTVNFTRTHSPNLDRKDAQMITAEEKQAKAAKRKAKLDAAIARADKAETALAAAQGKVDSLTADLEVAKNDGSKSRTDASEKFDAAVTAKVDLVSKASEVLGAGKVDLKLTDRAIKCTVVKHVDGRDIDASKHDAYVDAMFDGALERARKDTSAIAGGAAALAAARTAATTPVPPVNPDRTDAVDAEQEARQRASARLRNASATPGAITKAALAARK